MVSSPSTTASSPPATSLRTKISTNLITPQSLTKSDDGIITLRYEDSVAAKPPIAVTTPPPRDAPTDIHPALRRPKTGGDKSKDEGKRDSGLATTTSSRAGGSSVITTDAIEEEMPLGIEIDFDKTSKIVSPLQSPTLPSNPQVITKSPSMVGSMRWKPGTRKGSNNKPGADKAEEEKAFVPITMEIPTEEFLDEDLLTTLAFSKRGSVMLGGKKAVNSQARTNVGRRQPSISMLVSPTIKILPDHVEMESQKVRSMYEQGSNWEWEVGANSGIAERLNGDSAHPVSEGPNANGTASNGISLRPDSAMSTRQQHELAGGIEDWEDIDGNDVDRYGFIDMRRKNMRPGTPEPRAPHRVPTVLQLATEAPRKKRAIGRSASTATSKATFRRAPSRKVSPRSLKTVASSATQRSSRIRDATNRLPGNKDRRLMDEAGDMLTLPPGLADIAEDEEGGRGAEMMKAKEVERAEKWKKMAKTVKRGKDGEGMAFEFDASSPKLIDRTWKGIPDRWRASAWHSFLSTSAKKRKDSATDEQIIAAFHALLNQSSADDVQIDMDVPRTINQHIMFRRRYRGGQRLLFRVLHCLSLYFPDTGYVQGMASIVATLLCYYDEEMTFVMVVRLWNLRGLDKLYEEGFPGLNAALDEFRTQWLSPGPVSEKLVEMAIEPTAYGIRWYLTLFNYSIPFAAQLRVWDIFMLLGDPLPSVKPTPERPFAGGLDILHATSAALIDGTRDILMDSDFENTMKVLTSWIPVKDEELMMRVMRAEWKLKRGKR
ncbi:related to Rab6 GTPase activating protein, GAPCenA [Rhynchosporium agropyri]|uniref:Related to Rab6 GTPase activating protein, GAPCenA n=1 Tax=Rhynchosporium agropyri TaxID=914238 RepID=A0A1E1L8L6_9HELO|nr:related to Rab6 GTPase activating protein, GAPCenA [Rhynchosporium agropyri]